MVPTERALLIMEKLHRHGPLPSSFLLEYCRHRWHSDGRTLDCLTHLFNEDNTPDGGQYLTRPWQQFATLDARYHELVYDLNDPALDALAERDLLYPNTPGTSHLSWKHDAFCSAITASIELSVLKEPTKYQYIFHDEIVTRIGQFAFPVGGVTLRPDRALGIRYKAIGGARIFLIEADCGTEPNTAKRRNRKTQKRSIELYAEFLGHGVYKKYFPEGTRVMLLSVYASRAKMENVKAMAGRSAFTLFQHWGNFSRVFVPPKPRHDLFNGPWSRAGHGPFHINRA